MAFHHIGAASRFGAGAVAVALACSMGAAGVAFADEAAVCAEGDLAAEQVAGEPHITLQEEWQPAKDASEYVFSATPAAGDDAQLAGASAMLAFNQYQIDQIGKQCDAWSGACLGYAAAYSQTITSGDFHGWWEFDGNGGVYGESGFYGRNMTAEFDCYSTNYNEQSTLRMVYDAINQGKPVILYVTTTSGNQHWVTIVGYENADEGYLRPENFIMIDSNYAFTPEPISLTAHGYTLRYGDAFGNVRISKASAYLQPNRVAYEHFSDCYYGDWFVDSGVLDYAYTHGLVSGYSGSTLFGPYDSLTRGQVATILWRIAGEPLPEAADSTDDFDDVDYGMYYGDAVRWARQTGVVNGYDDDNVFKPDTFVSRQELACMIANYASKIAGIDTASDLSRVRSLVDSDEIASWAIDSMGWCMDAGVMNGVDEGGVNWARPNATAWRASMASMAAVLHRDVLHLG